MNFETHAFGKVLNFLKKLQSVSVSNSALIYQHPHFRIKCCYPFLPCIIFYFVYTDQLPYLILG